MLNNLFKFLSGLLVVIIIIVMYSKFFNSNNDNLENINKIEIQNDSLKKEIEQSIHRVDSVEAIAIKNINSLNRKDVVYKKIYIKSSIKAEDLILKLTHKNSIPNNERKRILQNLILISNETQK